MSIPRTRRRNRRQTMFTTAVADAQRPIGTPPSRLQQTFVEPQPAMNEDMADALSHFVRIITDTAACAIFGLGMGMLAEGLLSFRANGPRIFYTLTGSAIVVTRLIGSRTIQEWVDWKKDLDLATEVLHAPRERFETYWKAEQAATRAAEAISSQPSIEDQQVNETIVRILHDYYRGRTEGTLPAQVKLWSRRGLATRYDLAEHGKANARVREVLEAIADGNSLKPRDYPTAFYALFGCAPEEYDGRSLYRMGDNPATGQPVFRVAPPPDVFRQPNGLVLRRTRRSGHV
ncbi:MAG: hypothetical protein AMJ93_08590 [Anaerolineae bacterium SM23_84]|nr:MAG: hypothetical protein AMJ93_08590 [Anaerolineae bacterium SM23_84]